jgi:hypothetical protein
MKSDLNLNFALTLLQRTVQLQQSLLILHLWEGGMRGGEEEDKPLCVSKCRWFSLDLFALFSID